MLELHYSRWRAGFGALITLAFSGAAAYFAAVMFLSGNKLLQLPGFASAVFAALVLLRLVPLLRALLHEGAVVTMDLGGVHDSRHPHDFLAWHDVADISLGYRARHLRFILRDAARERVDVPGRWNWMSLFRRANGSDEWNVDLYLLAGIRFRIWQQACKQRQLGIAHFARQQREALRAQEARPPAKESAANRLSAAEREWLEQILDALDRLYDAKSSAADVAALIARAAAALPQSPFHDELARTSAGLAEVMHEATDEGGRRYRALLLTDPLRQRLADVLPLEPQRPGSGSAALAPPPQSD